MEPLAVLAPTPPPLQGSYPPARPGDGADFPLEGLAGLAGIALVLMMLWGLSRAD